MVVGRWLNELSRLELELLNPNVLYTFRCTAFPKNAKLASHQMTGYFASLLRLWPESTHKAASKTMNPRIRSLENGMRKASKISESQDKLGEIVIMYLNIA